MNVILGISAFYHDSAACIIVNGSILAAAQEERFTRMKHTAEFPANAIRFCLDHSGYSLDELDAVIFYDKPWLKFERLLETFYAYAPRGVRSFVKAMPIWAKEKLYLKKVIFDGLREIELYERKRMKLLFSEHHLSHAASAFFPSPYKEAAILTIDGVGEWCTASMAYGKDNRITTLKELHFPHSLGLLYSSFTYYLGFRVNNGEYKVMGLAPYGDPHSEAVIEFKRIIYAHLVDVNEDGSIWMNQEFFDYSIGIRMVSDTKWKHLFGFPRRIPEGPIETHHCNLALSIQQVIEEIIIKMVYEIRRLTGSENICLAGGVALNCVANGRLSKMKIFDHMFIQPAAGDAGGALGAALAVHYHYFENKRCVSETDDMQGALLGPYFSNKEVEYMLAKFKANFQRFEYFEDMANFVAAQMAESKIIGWFQGRAEFGPRALGNRSILADPRHPEMQQILNEKIKFRESFRPFAPAVLVEDANTYFDLDSESPYMLLVAKLKAEYRQEVGPDYRAMSLDAKLKTNKSELNAITHVDFSSRVQTVDATRNPKFYELIRAFKRKTGCPVVVNTSFNLRGEPIVNTPTDAYKTFLKSGIDILVINQYVIYKKSAAYNPENL